MGLKGGDGELSVRGRKDRKGGSRQHNQHKKGSGSLREHRQKVMSDWTQGCLKERKLGKGES